MSSFLFRAILRCTQRTMRGIATNMVRAPPMMPPACLIRAPAPWWSTEVDPFYKTLLPLIAPSNGTTQMPIVCQYRCLRCPPDYRNYKPRKYKICRKPQKWTSTRPPCTRRYKCPRYRPPQDDPCDPWRGTRRGAQQLRDRAEERLRVKLAWKKPKWCSKNTCIKPCNRFPRKKKKLRCLTVRKYDRYRVRGSLIDM